MLYFNI